MPVTLFLECETTGFHPTLGAEVVEVGVVNDAGQRVFYSLVRPSRRLARITKSIIGLTEAELRAAPRFAQVWPQLRRHLAGQEVVIWNAAFDRPFFPARMRCARKVVCAMRMFRQAYHTRHGVRPQPFIGFALEYLGKRRRRRMKERCVGYALEVRDVWGALRRATGSEL